MFRIILFICFQLLTSIVKCQESISLSIGDKIPDRTWSAIPKSGKEKLIILDFWATYCGGCIKAFPKMESLQKEFGNDLRIVMVNSMEDREYIHQWIKKRNRISSWQIDSFKLKMINGDTLLSKLFPFKLIPHYVWLDNNGKILAITESFSVTKKNIENIIMGKVANLPLKKDLLEYDVKEDGLLKSAYYALPTPLYYSTVMPYYPGITCGIFTRIDSLSQSIRVTWTNEKIINLFKTAFQIKEERILLEVEDKKRFEEPLGNRLTEEWKADNLFSYEISIPLRNRNKILDFMKSDLNNFFENYLGFKGTIERRMFNCLVLIKRADGLLNTKRGKSNVIASDSLYIWENQPFKKIVRHISKSYNNSLSRPFIDDTAFTGAVDMSISGDITDIENLKVHLNKYGLDLIEKEMEVEMLVIKDLK